MSEGPVVPRDDEPVEPAAAPPVPLIRDVPAATGTP